MGAHALRLLLALSSLAGCLLEVEAGGRDEAIVSGQPAPDEAVAALVARRSRCVEEVEPVCSGILIAPRALLTAAHCLESAPGPGELEVFFGGDVRGSGSYVVVADVFIDPELDPRQADHDLAVLALAADAPVAPIALELGDLDVASTGAPLRAVGFGVTAPLGHGAGVRRSGAMSLGSVRARSFDATPDPGLSCRGDSGGPVYLAEGGSERLVGITSGGDIACATRATQVRIDVALDSFIRPALAQVAALEARPGRIALSDLGIAECASDLDCPMLLSCGEDPSGARRCLLPGLGVAQVGASCLDRGSCGDGDCARIWPDGPDACRCALPSVPPPPPPPPTSTRSGGCSIGGGAPSSAIAAAIAALAGWRRRRR